MTPKCGKCGGGMDAGFVIEYTIDRPVQERWAGGKPEPNVALGVIDMGVKLEGRRTLPVTSWRCTACGFLESYANDEKP